jgi:PEP-CTERM motif
MRRLAILGSLIFVGLASSTMAGDVVLVHHSFSVTVVAVDAGITEIVPSDFFEIAYTIDQSVTDHNSSVGAGSFSALAVSFSLTARPLNAGTWHPMGTFDLAGSNYVTNAFGVNFTFQMRGNGFPNGGTGLPFFDLDLNWKWPGNISDSGLNDEFVQQFGGGTFNPARAVLGPSSIRFLAGPGDFRTAMILPETPALAGDYNANGTVDAADYTVWRDLAPGPGILLNDATPGTVSAADYDVWRAHFGQTAGSASGASATTAVPEPSTLLLLTIAAAGWCLCRGRAA